MIAMTTKSSISVKAFRAARLSRAGLPHREFERPLLCVFIFYSPSLSSRCELDAFVTETLGVNGDGRRNGNSPAAREVLIGPLLRVCSDQSRSGKGETVVFRLEVRRSPFQQSV